VKLALLLTLLASIAQAENLNLDQFLDQVLNQHKAIKSYSQSQQAAEYFREATDTVLSPQLSLQGGYIDDQKPTVTMPYYMINRTQGWNYSATLGKLFSTGTQASLSANLSQLSLSTTDRMQVPGSAIYSNQSLGVGSLGVSLAQSLWKDFFGRATHLRQDREWKTEILKQQTFNLQIKQIVVEAENAFWDLLYLQEELQQRIDTLQRSKKIEVWVKKRFSNGIGDKADVLNAEGLSAARSLQLLQTQDDIVAAKRKVVDLLELENVDQVPILRGDIKNIRKLESLVPESSKASASSRKVRLDSYLAILEAKVKSIGASEAEESMKPDLQLAGSYATNSYDFNNGITGAYNNLTNTNLPTLNVGLKFVWLLDSDLRNANRESARREALSSTFNMQRQLLESDSAWQEMNRRHQELTREVQAAAFMADVQNKKASAEREKLEKGRSITSQVITAEQDAAESVLTLTKLEVAQRKLESQARLFLNLEESK